ncbi:MAG: hypothetical protein AB7K36_31565, partial [Chloroflexota bacterium]
MWAILALAAFTVAVICHLVLVRLPLPFSNVIRYLLAGGTIGGGLVLLLLVFYGLSGEAFAGALIFAFLSELYIFFFTLVISSVSVSLMLYLRTGDMPEAEVSRIYDSRRMVTFRLEQLVRNGFATERDDTYALTPTGEFVVTWFLRLRRL